MSGYLQQQNQNNTQQPKSCERIVQGVAKLSTFKIPSTHLKRCSEGALPLNEQTIIGSGGQPKILVNGNINGKVVTKENNEGKRIFVSLKLRKNQSFSLATKYLKLFYRKIKRIFYFLNKILYIFCLLSI
ncbi:unnamed protein product [Meloidogyne enterolobii]|uniref:Uncharacterized protein n=1 Tax=Meloidogyne enterolobii TaxID=390850 RepID=A0ACB0ZQC0_MELEN